MKYLALDLASKTGWAITAKISGVWDFRVKREEDPARRLVKLYRSMSKLFVTEGFDRVVIERPNLYGTGQRMQGAFVGIEMSGVVRLWCGQRNIPVESVVSSQIKKFATGRGNAKKPDMVARARKVWGEVVIDDNHADALWLMAYVHSPLSRGVSE